MLLRWLVNSYVRQTAQQKFYELVGEALRGAPASPGPDSDEATSSGEATADEHRPQEPCAAVVLFASDLEAGGLIDRLTATRATKCARYVEFDGMVGQRRVVVAESGTGTAAAAAAADDAIALLRPPWVVSAGFAGSLDERLKRGSFVMAERIVDEAGRELAVGLKLDPAASRVHSGRLLTVQQVVRDAGQRRALGEQFQAVAYDLESLAVAEVCRARQVRFLSVRIISENLDEQLSPEVRRLLDNPSLAGKLGVAAASLLQRPAVMKELWQLREEAIALSDRLAKFLAGVLDQLN